MTKEELESRVKELREGSRLMKKVKEMIESNKATPETNNNMEYDDEYLLIDGDNYSTEVDLDAIDIQDNHGD